MGQTDVVCPSPPLPASHRFGPVTLLSLVWGAYSKITNNLLYNSHFEPTFHYVQSPQGRTPTSSTGTSPVSGTEDTKPPSHHHRSAWRGCASPWSSFSTGNHQHSAQYPLATSSCAVTMFLGDTLLCFSLLVWVKVAIGCT